MDVVINIEPDQEEEMCNKQKPQKKRSCSIWFWLCLIIVPVAIGAGLTAFFLIPRGPHYGHTTNHNNGRINTDTSRARRLAKRYSTGHRQCSSFLCRFAPWASYS